MSDLAYYVAQKVLTVFLVQRGQINGMHNSVTESKKGKASRRRIGTFDRMYMRTFFFAGLIVVVTISSFLLFDALCGFFYEVDLSRSGLKETDASVWVSLGQVALVGTVCIFAVIPISHLFVRRLVRPLLNLERRLYAIADGETKPEDDLKTSIETTCLDAALNTMVCALHRRELLAGEREKRILRLAADASLRSGEIMDASRRICEESALIFGVGRVGIWLFDAECTELRCLNEYNGEDHTYTQGRRISRSGCELFFEALEQERLIVVDDVFNDFRTDCLGESYLRSRKTASMICAGICGAGRMRGMICFEQMSQVRLWTEADAELAKIIASLGEAALEARDQRESRADLLRAREEAVSASQSKSRFLANMSHEIRTPLNGVIGMLKLLRRGSLDTQQRRCVQQGLRSSRILLGVINDILDFSKIEAGMLEIEQIPFNLRDIAYDAVQLFALQAEERQIQLSCVVQRNVPLKVRGDPARISQVLFNLISNAVKFTEPDGEVVVQVRLEDENEVFSKVRFEVRDTGKGISPAELNRVFEPFHQEERSTTRCYGGTGLGLGICRQLVMLMGGDIAVDSRPGRGSRFWFDLPLTRCLIDEEVDLEVKNLNGFFPHDARMTCDHDSSAGLFATSVSPLTAGETSTVKILLAEDNEINQMVGAEFLKMSGYSCDLASTGREAVNAVLTKDYDLVFMDCMMPEVNGYQATRQIRENEPEGRRVPIVALTANAIKGDREECLAAGMNDYLCKPFDPSQLVSMIMKWCPSAEGFGSEGARKISFND